jgi:hypothetical protein
MHNDNARGFDLNQHLPRLARSSALPHTQTSGQRYCDTNAGLRPNEAARLRALELQRGSKGGLGAVRRRAKAS